MKYNISQIKPVNDKVLVEIQHGPVKSQGGLFIPDADKKRSPLGKIIAFGPLVDDLTPNDIVYFDLYEGVRIDETHLMTTREFIYGIFMEGENDDV